MIFCFFIEKLIREADSWGYLYDLLMRYFPECENEIAELKKLKDKDVKINSKDFLEVMNKIETNLQK